MRNATASFLLASLCPNLSFSISRSYLIDDDELSGNKLVEERKGNIHHLQLLILSPMTHT